MNKLIEQLVKFVIPTFSVVESAPSMSGGGSKSPVVGPVEDGDIYGGKTSDVGDKAGKDGGSDEGEDFTDKAGKGDKADKEEKEVEVDTEETETETEVETEKEEPKAQVLKLDAETIAAIRGPQVQPRQEQEEAPLSTEQLKQMLNPVDVTPDLVAAIRDENPEVAQKALQAFANAVVKNAYSISKLLMQKKEREFSAMVTPLQERHQQAQVAEVRQSFYSKFANLQKYDKIVRVAAREVSPVDANGNEKTQEQIFKEVAGSTIATLKSLGIDITKPNANPSADDGENGNGVPKPNKFSSSGRSGGDDRNQKQKDDEQADIYRR
jgi:hypothetical protein